MLPPHESGKNEQFAVLELQPQTDYFFALKVFDEDNNSSSISNVPGITSKAGNLFTDSFTRDDLGQNWTTSDSFQIVNNELVNLSSDQDLWSLAVLNNITDPIEVSFKWSPSSDTSGIDQGGIALLLDSPDLYANGYLITCRTYQNQIRLWKIVAGQNPTDPIIEIPLLTRPNPGEEFKVTTYSDRNGNHFSIFINGWEDITITDSSFFIAPARISNYYAVVVLNGSMNNNIDDFKVLTANETVQVADLNINPSDYILTQNYPNPFNFSTTIEFYLPAREKVLLEIYNTRGQTATTLLNSQMPSGYHKVTFDA